MKILGVGFFLLVVGICSQKEVLALNHDTTTVTKEEISETFQKEQLLEPDEDIRSVFLRKSSVILDKGKWEFETGFYYQRDKYQLSDGRVDVDRKFYLPLNLRYGVSSFLEAALSIPVVHGQRESLLEGSQVNYEDTGVGDTNFSIKALLIRERNFIPEIIGSIQVRIPTGSDPYSTDGTKVGLGSGHWGVFAGVQFIKNSDPIVLFWGFDYSYEFEENYLGLNIQPGQSFGYNFGFGFAVNPDIALNILLSGKYEDEIQLNGNPLEGSSAEPILLRFGITNRWTSNVFIEPFVSFGLNSETTDSVIGFSLIYRF